MKDVRLALRNGNLQKKKSNRLQRRILLRYWMGWGGSYNRTKKETLDSAT